MAILLVMGLIYLAAIHAAVYLGMNGHPCLAVIVLLAGLSVSAKERKPTE